MIRKVRRRTDRGDNINSIARTHLFEVALTCKITQRRTRIAKYPSSALLNMAEECAEIVNAEGVSGRIDMVEGADGVWFFEWVRTGSGTPLAPEYRSRAENDILGEDWEQGECNAGR
jgi:hypothetical protein